MTSRSSQVAQATDIFAASSWEWTVACGALKIIIAVFALGLPLTVGRPVAESVGWMLVAGGAAEFALGWGAHRALLGKVTLGSGLLTMLAGMLFIYSGWTGLFPLTTVTMIWLLLRGMISLDVGIQARAAYSPEWFWGASRRHRSRLGADVVARPADGDGRRTAVQRDAGDGVELRRVAGDQLRGRGGRAHCDGAYTAPPRGSVAGCSGTGYGVSATLSTPSRWLAKSS